MTSYRMASVDTLARLCDAGSDGRHWYHYARRELANIAMIENTTFDRLCAVIAVTSPRVSVKKNLILAVNYIRTGDCSKGYLSNVTAALAHYEATGEIRGPKTSAFYRNLIGDETALVLDVWMARALGVPDDAVQRLSVRQKAHKRISQIARARCYTVAQVQACIWTAIRDIYGKRPVNFGSL